ncbi:hypothetical protein AMTR_s00037p00226920 [Amborella trichopoda]|uniref:Uncharacterized protein n=1 Tax=Amborella trichopoda TaxID=13333 RepID=U5DAJ4_AMBTC|nr:hypothetical protein AMTR_s00037p00226920 [Amborella trichopoda]
MSRMTQEGHLEENVRGRDPHSPAQGGKKALSNSKPRGEDRSTLEGRINLLENALGSVGQRLEKVEHDMETRESHTLVQLDQFKEDLESTLNAEEERVGRIESLEKKVMVAIYTIQAELDTLNASLEETKGRTLFVGSTSGIKDVPRADLPKLKEFKGVRDAKEVENFLWQVERYLEGLNLEDKQVKGNSTKGGGVKDKGIPKGGVGKSTTRQEYEEKKVFMPKISCFVRKGPHRMKECPKLGSLASIVEGHVAQTSQDQAMGHVGSLQLLNSLEAKSLPQTMGSKGLMYVQSLVNGRQAQVMIDTGATHNFITPEDAKRVGLSISNGRGWLKTINTNVKSLVGVAHGVGLCLGIWKGTVDLSVAPMEYYDSVCIL